MFEPRVHPMFVHFPIPLLFTSVLFDAAGTWFNRENFRDSALWLLPLGLLGGGCHHCRRLGRGSG